MYSACLYGALSIPEPFFPLYFLYSKHHNQLPKNIDPNSASATPGTRAGEDGKYGLLTSLQEHLYSTRVDTRYANERGLCSQLLSRYERSLSRISESANLDIVAEYLILAHGNDTSLSKPSEHSNDLLYVNCNEIHPYSKGKNFIETESNRNKLRGFNL